MSVTNPIYQASYAGRGDLGPYAITFDVTLDDGGNANDINVQVKDSLGTLTDITSTSTVTGMNVYTALVYDATYVVIVSRYPDLTQPYTFPYGTKFPSRTFENALDRQCFLLQRLYGDADLALKAPIAESPPSRIPSIADRANHHLAFDASGDPIVSTGIPDVPVTPFMQTLLDDTSASQANETLGLDAAVSVTGTVAVGDPVCRIAGAFRKMPTTTQAQVVACAQPSRVQLGAVWVDTNVVVVIYITSGAMYPVAKAGTVAADGTITWGTEVIMDTSHAVDTSQGSNIHICKTGTNKFVIDYCNSGTWYFMAGTVSGDVISKGSAVSTAFTWLSKHSTVMLEEDKFMVYGPGASNYPSARIATVSGTTISFGTAVAEESVAAAYAITHLFSYSSGTKFCCARTLGSSSGYVYATLGTISGTVPTFAASFLKYRVAKAATAGGILTSASVQTSENSALIAVMPGEVEQNILLYEINWQDDIIKAGTSDHQYGTRMCGRLGVSAQLSSYLSGDDKTIDATKVGPNLYAFSIGHSNPSVSSHREAWMQFVRVGAKDGEYQILPTVYQLYDTQSKEWDVIDSDEDNRILHQAIDSSGNYIYYKILHWPAVIGIADEAGSDTSIRLKSAGKVTGLTGASVGQRYFLGVAGELQTIGDEDAYIGKAISATEALR